MRQTLVILCFAVALTACVTTRPAPRPSYVTLEHDSGTLWRATYHLDAPIRELRFQRPGSGFRAHVFEVITPGYAFRRDGDSEILRTDGEPARVITVRFPEYTAELPKDYELFQKFTDGSVAIYTGHLLANASDEEIRAFRLVPRGGESIIVAGKLSALPVMWSDESGDGTYVYFGSIAAVEAEVAISIVDPGLPDWLERKTRDALPRLFELYTRGLGAELPQRPTVLFNYVAGDGSGFSSSGGTLPNLVQLRVESRTWERESEEGLQHLFHFLAHEAAHLWNGQIANYPGTEDSWMHEGGADALAERALLELGLITESRFLEYQTAALNECRRSLGKFPLREAAARGDFGLYYSCGNVIALLTDAAVDADLFTFWKSVVRRTLDTNDKKYGRDDYLAVWRKLGATANDVATLQSIVDEAADPEKIVAALTANGVRISESDEVPQPYGQALSRGALMHLLRENCTGAYGFRSTPAGFHLDEPLHCRDFPSGGLVKRIGGQNVIRAGHRAWDSLHATCGTGRPLSVRVDDRELAVACSSLVAARPAYLRILGVSR